MYVSEIVPINGTKEIKFKHNRSKYLKRNCKREKCLNGDIKGVFSGRKWKNCDDFNLNTRIPWFSSFADSITALSTARFGISYQLLYFICMCWLNVATYIWKVHNGKIETISFVVKFHLQPYLAVIVYV